MTDGAGVVWNWIGAPKKGDGFKDLEYFHPQNKGQVKIPIFKGSIPKPARQASNFSKAAFEAASALKIRQLKIRGF